jgi:hypothetical protein
MSVLDLQRLPLRLLDREAAHPGRNATTGVGSGVSLLLCVSDGRCESAGGTSRGGSLAVGCG